MERPVGFYIIALLQVMVGLYLVMTSTIWFGVNLFGLILASPENATIRFAVSLIGIAIGLFMFALAGAFFNGKKWAWTVTLIVQIISILRELLSVGFGGSTIGAFSIVLSLVIIFYLFRPKVRAHFAS